MKPAAFAYAVPGSVEEAVALKAEHGDDATVLAGGQSLVPLMALRMARPALLLDVNGLAALAHMRVEGDLLVIGATTRQRAVERDAGLARRCPVLGDAVPMIGHVAIRNRGTVGGSVAHADPAAEWPALLLALDGEVRVQGPEGTRTIAAQDFFVGPFMTAIEPEELVVAVAVRVPRGAASAFVELARRHGDFAVVGAAVVLEPGPDGNVTAARVALTGVGEVALRIPEAEALLTGDLPSDERLAEVQAVVREAVRPRDDGGGYGAAHRDVAGVIARRAVSLARSRWAAA